ncbi:MAG: NADH-quinone oxidoreductase subunit NuoE [Gammaproteobacteria bacterium]|nr:NADH-quinone oxidoreductase subunit NuoE [Gammaproteobacteria bacterium]
MSEKIKTLLNDTVREKIDHWMKRYPAEQKRSAVMAALHFTQEENNGWLSDELLEAVADYLDMSKIAVYEVATFYTMYNLKPVGKHIIEVCTSISCMLCGCDKIVDHLQKKLNIDFDETTPDGKFTLRRVECLASCTTAPMLQVGKKYYESLTPEKVDTLLAELE